MVPEVAGPVDRAESLLAAAERLYAERGNRPVPIGALARDVGLPEQQVYNYVGSEEALYVACHRRGRAALERTIDAISNEPVDPGEQLRRGLLAILSFIEEHRAGWEALAEREPAGFGPASAEIAASRREMIRLISQLFTEARIGAGVDPEVDTETAASAMIGAIIAVARWWRENPEVPAAEIAAAMSRVLWGGLPAALEA